MSGRTRAAVGNQPVTVASVQIWGPEPIGAAIAESIQTQYGASMASMSGQLVGWGIAGSDPLTSQEVFAPVQTFVGQAGLGATVGMPIWGDLGGLPNTVMPAGLSPYGLG